MEKISPPIRIFALIAVLAGLGGAAFLFTAGGAPAAASSPLPVLTHAQAVKAAAAKQTTATERAVKTTSGSHASVKPLTPAKPKRSAPHIAKPKQSAPAVAAAPKPAPKLPEPATGLPVAIDKALANHELVVVSLVVPGAQVDELAAAEARAGAKLAGSGFIALNVLNEGVARSLLARLGTLDDQSVLLVRRGGEVVLKLGGFVDRDTVAQAAANASA